MLDHLIGNEKVRDRLALMLAEDRIPQSAMFVGASGLGKKTFAFRIAMAFVCEQRKAGQGCGTCRSCLRTTRIKLPTSGKKEDFLQVFFTEHPDVGMVSPNKKTIYIDAIRHLEREANFRPYEAERRVFIIDEAEKMTPQAANALLKTLEEPPETSHIFLITSEPSRLPLTIKSRCQTIRFSPIPEKEIAGYLFENEHASSADAQLLANLSGGSLGYASAIDLEQYRKFRENAIDAIRAANTKGSASVMLRSAELLAGASDAAEFEYGLDVMNTLAHDLWRARISGGTKIANIDIEKEVIELSAGTEKGKLERWLLAIEEVRENLRSNLNRKIAADALFMNLLS